MFFTSILLEKTAFQFHKALLKRDLPLPLSTARSVWTEITFGKKYPPVIKRLRDCGGAIGIPITVERIRSALARRNRSAEHRHFIEIFCETIDGYMWGLSPSLKQLADTVAGLDESCVISVAGDKTGMGVIDAHAAGYVGASRMPNFNMDDTEAEWCRSSASLMVAVVNYAAGVADQRESIFRKSYALDRIKRDMQFAQFCREHAPALTDGITARTFPMLIGSNREEWEVEFDSVRDAVYSAFEKEAFRTPRLALDLTGNLAEMLFDHTAAQLRDLVRCMAENDDSLSLFKSPEQSIVSTVNYAFNNLLSLFNNAQAGGSISSMRG